MSLREEVVTIKRFECSLDEFISDQGLFLELLFFLGFPLVM